MSILIAATVALTPSVGALPPSWLAGASVLAVGSLEASQLARTSSALAVGAPDPRRKRIRRIDRAHVVGAPVLDGKARAGVYVWREDGLFRFAVVGGEPATEFQVRANRPLRLKSDDALTWIRRGPRHYVGRSRAGQGAIETKGHIKIGKARRGGRRVRIYLGPLAQRAASTVEIGAFGAAKR